MGLGALLLLASMAQAGPLEDCARTEPLEACRVAIEATAQALPPQLIGAMVFRALRRVSGAPCTGCEPWKQGDHVFVLWGLTPPGEERTHLVQLVVDPTGALLDDSQLPNCGTSPDTCTPTLDKAAAIRAAAAAGLPEESGYWASFGFDRDKRRFAWEVRSARSEGEGTFVGRTFTIDAATGKLLEQRGFFGMSGG